MTIEVGRSIASMTRESECPVKTQMKPLLLDSNLYRCKCGMSNRKEWYEMSTRIAVKAVDEMLVPRIQSPGSIRPGYTEAI